MDALSAAQESFVVNGCAKQADSDKRSAPRWTLPKASRATEQKMFISKKHPQDVLGKDSPGHVYEPKRQQELPSWGFGTSAQRPPSKMNKYNEPFNDLVGNIPDSSKLKYHDKQVYVSLLPRSAQSNSPDLEGYVMGAISPGPQRYNIDKCPPGVRLGHAPSIDQIPPKYTMRPKTMIMGSKSQTGEKIGPGYYPTPESCGAQASSVKRSLPQWNICKIDRFKENRSSDAGRLWDGMKEQKEKNCRMFNSTPSFSFGTSTRDHQLKIARCTTKIDEGPSANMEKMHVRAPSVAPRKEIMKYSDVPAG